jgi:hypothetical protein
MRIELVAQHRQLRARRLVLQDLHLIDLLLDDQIEIDPEIERRPACQHGEVEEGVAEHAADRDARARPR